jgi:two-component system cell cycle response regulator DivK
LETNNGAEALDLVRQHRPDLVLMDIQLSNVSGLEIIKSIKADAELKSIPVIAVSAFATQWDTETMRELGCEACLTKPITIISFIEAVETALR